MKRFPDLTFLLRRYRQAPLATRLFILARYLVCPWDSILDRIPCSGNVLDIGCGHGLFLHLANRRYPRLQGMGFDHDAGKIECAKLSAQEGTVSFLSDTETDKLAPLSFDCVTFIDVLYSIPPEKWFKVLSFAHTHLKPGGIIVVKETVTRPRWKYHLCRFQETIALKALRYTKGDAPRLESVEFYLEQVSKNGFEIEDHGRLDHWYPWPHYLFVAKKR